MKKMLFKSFSILLSCLMTSQVGYHSFAMLPSDEGDISASDAVRVNVDSDEEDLDKEIEMQDMKIAVGRKKRDGFRVQVAANKKIEDEKFDQVSENNALIKDYEEQCREKHTLETIDSAEHFGELERKVDRLEDELEDRREDDCPHLKSVDDCCQKRFCCHTHFARTFSRRFWKGAICTAGIVGVGVVVVAIGAGIYYFSK